MNQALGWELDAREKARQLAAAERKLAAIRELHANTASQVHGNWCKQCHTYWPCLTIAILDSAGVSEQGSEQ